MKNSRKKRDEISKGQDVFKDSKENARKHFKSVYNREPSGNELLKMRLAKQQNDRCMYSGKGIDLNLLFSDDKYTEVDHVLPYSRTFDNSLNNKVLVLTSENQNKRNQTPFEMWGSDENSQKWHEFIQRVRGSLNIKGLKKKNLLNTTLPKKSGKSLTNEDMEEENGFISRNLIDVQFMARFTKNFVENNLQFKENNTFKQKVKTRNGALISQLRYLWGIGEKNRGNHLHHAEDAIILAFSTQAEVQRMSFISAQFEEYKFKSKEEKEKIKKLRSETPFNKNEFKTVVDNIFVSHAPRRKVTGAAHAETLYSGKKYKVKKRKDGKIKQESLVGVGKMYPIFLNKGKTLAKNFSMPRVDLFRHLSNKKYYLVPLYVLDFVKKSLPNKAIVAGTYKKNDPNGKYKKGDKKPWIEMDENYEFICSFYKNDLIKVIKEKEVIFGLFQGVGSSTGNISIKNIIGNNPEKNVKDKQGNDTGLIAQSLGVQNVKEILKYETTLLGEVRQVKLPQVRVGVKRHLKEMKKESQLNKTKK